MTWKYELMGTEFERVLAVTLVLSVGVPIVFCFAAESLAPQILLGSGTLFQLIALGLGAFELNKMDVQTFKGPGFMVRMGWRPGRSVNIQLTGSTANAIASTGVLSATSSDNNSIEARLKRLEDAVGALRRVDDDLRKDLQTETRSRKEAIQALSTELRNELGGVEAQLKDVALGDLERLYVALLLGGVGTVFSTLSQSLGKWFMTHPCQLL